MLNYFNVSMHILYCNEAWFLWRDPSPCLMYMPADQWINYLGLKSKHITLGYVWKLARHETSSGGLFFLLWFPILDTKEQDRERKGHKFFIGLAVMYSLSMCAYAKLYMIFL